MLRTVDQSRIDAGNPSAAAKKTAEAAAAATRTLAPCASSTARSEIQEGEGAEGEMRRWGDVSPPSARSTVRVTAAATGPTAARAEGATAATSPAG